MDVSGHDLESVVLIYLLFCMFFIFFIKWAMCLEKNYDLLSESVNNKKDK